MHWWSKMIRERRKKERRTPIASNFLRYLQYFDCSASKNENIHKKTRKKNAWLQIEMFQSKLQKFGKSFFCIFWQSSIYSKKNFSIHGSISTFVRFNSQQLLRIACEQRQVVVAVVVVVDDVDVDVAVVVAVAVIDVFCGCCFVLMLWLRGYTWCFSIMVLTSDRLLLLPWLDWVTDASVCVCACVRASEMRERGLFVREISREGWWWWERVCVCGCACVWVRAFVRATRLN